MPRTSRWSENVFATPYEDSLQTLQEKFYWGPEKKLMLAVLEDAIACFQKYIVAHDPKGKMLFHEAEYWIQDTKNDWTFSFANVCEMLGVDPDYLRQGLAQWKARKLDSRAKARIYRLTPRKGKRKRGMSVMVRARHRWRRAAGRGHRVDCIYPTKRGAEAFQQIHELYIYL